MPPVLYFGGNISEVSPRRDSHRRTLERSAQTRVPGAWRTELRRRLRADRRRADASALRRERRREGASLSARIRAGLGDCRVRDASQIHPHAQSSRDHAARTYSGDTAPHRALTARRRGHGQARRAHADRGLRRSTGRWRHANRRRPPERTSPCDRRSSPLASEMACPALPIRCGVAAASVGIVDGEAMLDLCYDEDRRAEVDFNIVMTDGGEFVEVQGTAERGAFSPGTAG